jgi:hypothetical protein
MSTLLEVDYDVWFNIYKPIPNHIDKGASFNDGEQGYMFETYGKELEFVKAASDRHIWTYGDGDDGGTYIWSGWSFVNRIGYFITEVPFSDGVDVQVLVSEPDLTDEYENETIEETLEENE